MSNQPLSPYLKAKIDHIRAIENSLLTDSGDILDRKNKATMPTPPIPPDQQALKEKISNLKSTKEALVNAINDRIKATDDAISYDMSDFLDRKNKEINSLFLADTVVSRMFDQYGCEFCCEFHMSGDSFSEIVRNVHDAISCKIRELKRWESKYTTALARRTDEKNRLTELLQFLEKKLSDNSSQGEV